MMIAVVPGRVYVLPGGQGVLGTANVDAEDRTSRAPTPVAGLRPPEVSDKLVPVFTEDELAAILATCKGGGFQNRRDYAVMSLFKTASR